MLPYGFGLRYGEPGSLSNSLNEQVAADNSLDDLVLFERAVKPPYQLVLHSNDDSKTMDSSVAQLANIAVRTFDNKVQEDARRLSFSGAAKVSLTSAFPADLRAYQESGSALVIELQHTGTVPEQVLLGMDCAQSCNSSINIAPQLKALAANSWHSLSVDLACFAKQGADFSQIFTPLSLQASGTAELSFTDIRLQPGKAASADLRCTAD